MPSEIAKVKIALTEVLARREAFSSSTYTQVVVALYDKLRLLQTVEEDNAPSVKSDENRLVTVMFVDIADSTQIARRLEEDGRTEDWKAIIGEAHKRLAGVVEQWDGEVGQYLGDGLLCFFGASRSQGDEAQRAVSCALAIQEEMGRYAGANHALGIAFGVRIGISTGRVVVGRIGTDKKNEVLAVGPATNLASRLQSLTAPGGVLIDAETYYRVYEHFVIESLPPAEIKGFDSLVEVYAVVKRHQPLPVQFMTNALAGIEIPFVGRETELDQIDSALDRAVIDRRFEVITLYGEVGIGKSRLLQEVLFRVLHKSYVQMSMVANYEKRANSYSLLRNLLAVYCSLSEDAPATQAEARITDYVRETWEHPDADAMAAVVGYLSGYGFESHSAVQPFKREGIERETMALAWLGKWFRGQAEAAPLLLAVDNLQWADPSSLRMLEHVARQLADGSGVLFVTARPEFQRMAYMRGVERHTEIRLEPLNEAATSVLVQSVLRHVSSVPEPLPAVIIGRAQGNPLFVEEFLRMLFDNGVFERDESGWKVNTFLYRTLTSTLPTGLLGVLQARLDDLDEKGRRVIQVAAVIGQTFWSGCVSELAQFNAQAALNDLVSRGLIEQNRESTLDGETEYFFRHSLYREVAYEILTRSSRGTYHQQAAHWLMERVANRPEYFDVLADHLVRGKQREQALAMYVAASDDRLQRGLLPEALKLVESGLAAAREIPREAALPLVSRLWIVQGQTLNELNRYKEALAACQTAQMLMQELPANDLLEERVTAGYTLADAYRKLGQYNESFEALTVAHDLLPSGKSLQLSEIVRSFGALARYRGRLDDGQAYHERALKLAEEAGSRLQVAANVLALGLVALDRGELAVALSQFKRALEGDRQSSNIYYQVMDFNYLGMVFYTVCAYQKALECFNQAEELQQRMHYRDPLVEANRGLCQIVLGQADEGLALLMEITARQHQNAYTRHLVHLALLAGLAQAGCYSECVESASVFTAEVRERNPIFLGRGLLWQGIAQHVLGDTSAQDSLRQALDNELLYGGRDTWLCYYALGRGSNSVTQRAKYYANAAAILSALATSLEVQPELSAALINDDFVQAMLDYASNKV